MTTSYEMSMLEPQGRDAQILENSPNRDRRQASPLMFSLHPMDHANGRDQRHHCAADLSPVGTNTNIISGRVSYFLGVSRGSSGVELMGGTDTI